MSQTKEKGLLQSRLQNYCPNLLHQRHYYRESFKTFASLITPRDLFYWLGKDILSGFTLVLPSWDGFERKVSFPFHPLGSTHDYLVETVAFQTNSPTPCPPFSRCLPNRNQKGKLLVTRREPLMSLRRVQVSSVNVQTLSYITIYVPPVSRQSKTYASVNFDFGLSPYVKYFLPSRDTNLHHNL